MRRARVAAMLAALVVALVVAGCATTPPDPDARNRENFPLAAYASHEECLDLRAGDRLDYRFRTSAPVGFDIHYRDGSAVVAPIERDGVTADSGIYQPVLAHEFCLAWQAGATPLTLEYHVAVRRRAP